MSDRIQFTESPERVAFDLMIYIDKNTAPEEERNLKYYLNLYNQCQKLVVYKVDPEQILKNI